MTGANKEIGESIIKAVRLAVKDIDNNFLLASKNVPKIDILPVAGINVFDILKIFFHMFLIHYMIFL